LSIATKKNSPIVPSRKCSHKWEEGGKKLKTWRKGGNTRTIPAFTEEKKTNPKKKICAHITKKKGELKG